MQYYNNTISNREYLTAAHELTMEENQRDSKLQEAAISNYESDLLDRNKEYNDIMQEAANSQYEATNFFSNVKNSLLSECIYKIYKDSYLGAMNEQEKTISKNLVNRFVLENGAQNLLNSFRTKNLLLSEVNRIVNKYYNAIVEECGNGDCDRASYVVPNVTRDEFLDELEDLDTEDASKLIKDRVSDSITNFMDANALAKLEYEEMLNGVQDHINSLDVNDPNAEVKAQEESTFIQYKIQEQEARREKNIFNCIVQKLAESSIRDDKLKSIYMEGANLNMDKVVDHSQLFYTMLEMVNTTEMIPVDAEYLNKYINSL